MLQPRKRTRARRESIDICWDAPVYWICLVRLNDLTLQQRSQPISMRRLVALVTAKAPLLQFAQLLKGDGRVLACLF